MTQAVDGGHAAAGGGAGGGAGTGAATDTAAGGSALPGIQSRGWLRSWWMSVLLVYAGARVVTTTMLLVLASVQGQNPWTGAKPSYFDYASIWDGTWYKIIAYWGYPSQLPLNSSGHIDQNSWAFLPGYPFLVRGLTTVTGVPWEYMSVFVSLFFGAGAALVFYKLLRVTLPHGTSMFAVLLFCAGPVSPMFQVAYAESMYMFLLMVALYLLVKRRYAWLFPVVLVMSFTRPSGLAFALALGFHIVHRWWVRARDPFPLRERVLAVGAAAFSVIVGLLWTGIAWAATGYAQAYTETELAWRAAYIGYSHLVPFASWIQGGNWWLEWWLKVPASAGVGAVVVLLLVALFALAMAARAVRRIHIDLRFWVIAYAVYLLAVFFPQSSTFRLLMPLFPLLGVVALPKSRIYRVAVVVVLLAAQWGWLLICWGVDGLDWSPP